ncbi:MAG TPA: DUF2115 domain-containing protein [Methanobacterium sp.]|nr:DUF2115 domain-containing protein [Methanobacterium sp.]
MVEKIENLDLNAKISKKNLLSVLRNESDDIHIFDIMTSYVQLVEDGKYVQSSYQKDYLEAYIKGFLMRVKDIRDDKTDYEGYLDNKELQKALNTLKNQEAIVEKERSIESNFFRIYEVVSLYTTFILEEPIHMVGTLFPGGFRVKLEGKAYYCPVKEKQKDNPGAVCGFCIAEQDEDVL